MLNVISVDVEDYFHPSEVCHLVDPHRWDKMPSRIEAATGLVLDLFAKHRVRATFFALGWVAERHPALVRRIVEAGHEVGCHSYSHRLVFELTPEEFREDTVRAVSAIANACEIGRASCRERVSNFV
jgi:hypothetical protein